MMSALPPQGPWRCFVRVLRKLGYPPEKGKGGFGEIVPTGRFTRWLKTKEQVNGSGEGGAEVARRAARDCISETPP